MGVGPVDQQPRSSLGRVRQRRCQPRVLGTASTTMAPAAPRGPDDAVLDRVVLHGRHATAVAVGPNPPWGELLIPPLGSRIIRREDSGRRPRSFARPVVVAGGSAASAAGRWRHLAATTRDLPRPAGRPTSCSGRACTPRTRAAVPAPGRLPGSGVGAGDRWRAHRASRRIRSNARLSWPPLPREAPGASCAGAPGGCPPWRPARPCGRRPAGTASPRACWLTASSAAGRGCWSWRVGCFLVGLEVCVAPMRRRGLGVATGRLPGGNDGCYLSPCNRQPPPPVQPAPRLPGVSETVDANEPSPGAPRRDAGPGSLGHPGGAPPPRCHRRGGTSKNPVGNPRHRNWRASW
jgi:hypothetical protein